MNDARDGANYKKILTQNKMIMLAPAGSELLGLKNAGEGDSDEMGICLESAKQLIGFAPFEQDIYRSAEDRTGNSNEPSQSGDVDLVIYGLRKFVRLVMGGNPNLISMLFVPKDLCKIYSPIAAELQELTPKILNKRMSNAFLGYLEAQRQRLLGTRGQKNVNRNELVIQHGYDTKYAMHMIRLGIQGYELFSRGKLCLPMQEGSIKILRDIRQGAYSLDRIIKYAQSYEENIKEFVEESKLPEKSDTAAIENWLLSKYKKAWNERINEEINEDSQASQ